MSWSFAFECSSTVGLFGIRDRFDSRIATEDNAIVQGQIKVAGRAIENMLEQLHNGEAHIHDGWLRVNTGGHVHQEGTAPSFISASLSYEERKP